MKLQAKDSAKVRALHDELMSIADKYEMSMEDLLEMAMEGEEPEMEMDDESEDYSEEKPAMDKAKIALVIGKMRGHRGGEE